MADPVAEPAAPTLGLRRGQGLAIAGIVLAAMAIWVAPLVLGPLAALAGLGSYLRGERRGRWVIVLAVVAIGLGLLLNALPDKFAYS
ncbi:MAG: hypothetical protein U0V73_15375 [Acidimicrobiia bacterium]